MVRFADLSADVRFVNIPLIENRFLTFLSPFMPIG
jgi:hypothetical protein